MDNFAQLLQTRLTVASLVVAEAGAWLNFCSAIEDGNPRYWGSAEVEERICPPAMVSAWARPQPWRPGEQEAANMRALELHHRLKEFFGYPYGVVEDIELDLDVAVRAGDRLTAEQRIVECGEEEARRLGTGRRWIIEVAYSNQKGELVAQERVRLFAYRA